MEYRILGRTGIRVSAISFGAGPVSSLMTGPVSDAQLATVASAIDAGINWIDTAPGYGQGLSESNLGRVIGESELSTSFRSGTRKSSDDGLDESQERKSGDFRYESPKTAHCRNIHVATKVRIPDTLTESIADYVKRSLAESLARLRLPRVTLLQLHNGLTKSRGDQPSSITPDDVLSRGGVLDAFRGVQKAGLVEHIGLTGTGNPDALTTVIRSGEFDTIQLSYNLLDGPLFAENRSGGPEAIIAECVLQQMGVFAIRVFAGGAILGQPPSAHTLKTPYFPLERYLNDATRVKHLCSDTNAIKEQAIRFVLNNPAIGSAIIGFGSPEHVREVRAFV